MNYTDLPYALGRREELRQRDIRHRDSEPECGVQLLELVRERHGALDERQSELHGIEQWRSHNSVIVNASLR